MPYKLTIGRTGRSKMSEKPHIFDKEIKLFNNIRDLDKFVREQYTDGFEKGQDIFQDTKKGAIKIGKIKTLGWQRDMSHNEPEKWFQQDWVSVSKVVEKPVNIDLIRKKLRKMRR